MLHSACFLSVDVFHCRSLCQYWLSGCKSENVQTVSIKVAAKSYFIDMIKSVVNRW